ncbi:hypothetical protein [Micromonospora sp. NPDC023737]|uniref:hypothetical protein n=1 Tax=unclassified Micromonospora TaxID=2617518 RepID=UPI0033FC0BFE
MKREFRPKRWEQHNRRPARVSLGSRSKRQRYTKDAMDHAAELSMDVGVMMGRRFGERDLYQALVEMCDDPEALAEWVRKQAAKGEEEEEERRWWSDDNVTELAREAGVLGDAEDKALWDSVPPKDIDGESVVVEIEQWLRERDRWIDNLREHGDLPDDEQ